MAKKSFPNTGPAFSLGRWGPRPQPAGPLTALGRWGPPGPWPKPSAPGFTPYQPPTTAPPGSYDPALDAQGDNANLGYLYGTQDYTLNKQRLADDYAIGQGDTTHQYDTGLRDLTTSRDRGLADLLTGRTRGTEDYNQSIANLQHQYDVLGSNQAQAANAAGVSGGGALAQALAKRTANQARDRQPMDTNYSRFLGDNQQTQDRLNQDFTTQSGDLTYNRDHSLSALGLQFSRGNTDLDTGQFRSGLTNAMFGQQLNTEKLYAAGQAGMLPGPGDPGGPPVNEFTRGGQTFRTEVHNGVVYRRHPDGRMVPIRKATG